MEALAEQITTILRQEQAALIVGPHILDQTA